MAYNAHFKLQAIAYAAEIGNRAAARHLNINESMVRKWRKQGSFLPTKLSFRVNKARFPERITTTSDIAFDGFMVEA